MTFPVSPAVPCRRNALGSSNGASAGRPTRSQFFCINGVDMAPGATALMRTSRPPFSCARRPREADNPVLARVVGRVVCESLGPNQPASPPYLRLARRLLTFETVDGRNVDNRPAVGHVPQLGP